MREEATFQVNLDYLGVYMWSNKLISAVIGGTKVSGNITFQDTGHNSCKEQIGLISP